MDIQPSKSRTNFWTGGLVGAIVSAVVFGTTAPPALAQRILNPNPAQGAQSVGTQPAISASFEALNGVGVQPNTMRVLLDGEDVSDRAVITSDFFSYRPSTPLAPGSHQIVLEYENTRGVPQRASWSFNVSAPSRTAIDSVTHNGNNRPLGSGEVLLATVTGTPNSDVVLYLVQDGQRVQTLTTEEVSSGTYVANVLVEAKDATREGILVSRLENQGEIRFATAEMPVRLIAETATMQQLTAESMGEAATTETSMEALQPEVTNYQNGDRFSGSSILLEGTTLPNATVEVSGSANTELIGGFLGTQQELSSKTVEADSEGNFSVSMGLPALSQSGTTYTLELKGTANGQTSPTTSIELVQE